MSVSLCYIKEISYSKLYTRLMSIMIRIKLQLITVTVYCWFLRHSYFEMFLRRESSLKENFLERVLRKENKTFQIGEKEDVLRRIMIIILL